MSHDAHPSDPVSPALADLAADCGVDTGHLDSEGRWNPAPRSTVVHVLGALGVAADYDEAAERSLRGRRRERARRLMPPSLVVRQGWTPRVRLAAPEGETVRLELRLEDGRTTHPAAPPTGERVVLDAEDGAPAETLSARRLELDPGLPLGRHLLRAETDSGTRAEMVLVVTPTTIPLPAGLADRPAIGLATQLYQVRSARSWAMGDLSDLADLADWGARELGADYVLVNPMHAAEPTAPVEPSPYLPTSRRFVSPLYVRPEELPEFADLDDAERRRIDRLAADVRGAVDADTIDRDATWTAKLEALRLLHRVAPSARRAARYRRFVRESGVPLQRFALWSALAGVHGPDWHRWPETLRDPESPEVAAAAEDLADELDFHTWLQWVTVEQRADAQRDALRAGMRIGIVHDLAVGVHPAGADAWALTRSLARGVSVGAPPDMYNQRGQDWSQPPLRPDALAEQGYAPLRDLVRAALRDAGGLRIDHILGLFRLWWIPEGAAPTEGTYVRYDADAMIGVLALEAERAGAVVVGEDLGTVAPGVRELLSERGVFGTSILWFERDDEGRPIAPGDYRRGAMSSVTTHDLPPTAGFVDLVHVDIRDRLGQLTGPVEQERERAAEEVASFVRELHSRGLLENDDGHADPTRVVEALHRHLGRTPSLLPLVAVADLVGDRRPVNIPGTSDDYPNWRVPLSGPDSRSVSAEELHADARGLAHRLVDAVRAGRRDVTGE